MSRESTILLLETLCERYQLLDIGWEEFRRVYKDGKIWIQRNMTEADLAQELVEMGVPKEDIVLGLQPLYKRPYTEYAVS